MRLGINGLAGYAAGVISSKSLRAWLFEQAQGKRQKDLAVEWGLEQPTVSRLKTQTDYDIPLDTIAKIATAFGCRDLSEFFRQVEQNIGAEQKFQTVTGSVPLKGDKESPTSRGIESNVRTVTIHFTEEEYTRHLALLERARVITRSERTREARRRTRASGGSRPQKSVRGKSRH